MTLKNKLLENTDIFIGEINKTPGEHFNTKPATESWSVADVLEHIYRSEFGIPRLFTGETQVLTDRKPDARLPLIKETSLDTDTKMKAGKVVLPKNEEKNKEDWIKKFRNNRLKIADLIEELPEDELCLKYEHPIFGYLTRKEWVHFCILHTIRHIRQLNRIQSQLPQTI